MNPHLSPRPNPSFPSSEIITIGNSVAISYNPTLTNNPLKLSSNSQKKWIFRARGSTTCEKCMQYDGKVYDDLSEAPKLPLHPNCDCYYEEIISEETNEEENDYPLKDLTAQFDKTLAETHTYFTEQRRVFKEHEKHLRVQFSKIYPFYTKSMINAAARAMINEQKLEFFASKVGTGKQFDLKATKEYSFDEIGKNRTLYRGQEFRYDDFGNYNYGVAAKAFGLSELTALAGAGFNQVFQTGEGYDLTNLEGFGDDPQDTQRIKEGYHHSWQESSRE